MLYKKEKYFTFYLEYFLDKNFKILQSNFSAVKMIYALLKNVSNHFFMFWNQLELCVF